MRTSDFSPSLSALAGEAISEADLVVVGGTTVGASTGVGWEITTGWLTTGAGAPVVLVATDVGATEGNVFVGAGVVVAATFATGVAVITSAGGHSTRGVGLGECSLDSAATLVPFGRISIISRSGFTNCDEITSAGPLKSNTIRVLPGLTSATRISLTR